MSLRIVEILIRFRVRLTGTRLKIAAQPKKFVLPQMCEEQHINFQLNFVNKKLAAMKNIFALSASHLFIILWMSSVRTQSF
jgi:hypothetical protein